MCMQKHCYENNLVLPMIIIKVFYLGSLMKLSRGKISVANFIPPANGASVGCNLSICICMPMHNCM